MAVVDPQCPNAAELLSETLKSSTLRDMLTVRNIKDLHALDCPRCRSYNEVNRVGETTPLGK